MAFHVPEEFRVKTGFMGSDSSYKNNGQFFIKSLKFKKILTAQASDGFGWQHVSVSLPNRCPTWDEMNFIKDLFWDKEDAVIQIHPSRSEYVNNHPYCLHLWKSIDEEMLLPPKELV